MLQLKIEVDQLARKLAFSEIQTRKLIAVTLTQAAYNVQKELQEEMRRVFKNPTDFVIRSVFVKQAKIIGDKVAPAIIGIRGSTGSKVSPAHALYAEVAGGERRRKRSEIMMARVMPKGMTQWVPGAAAPRNASGDIPGGYLQKVISALQVQQDYAANSPTAGSTGFSRGDLRKAAKGGAQFGRNGQIKKGLRGYGAEAQRALIERQNSRDKNGNRRGTNFFVGSSKGSKDQRIVYQFEWYQAPGKRRPNNPNPEPVLLKANVRPVLVFTRTQQYKTRLLMAPVAQRVVNQDVRKIANDQALRLFAKWNGR